MMNIYLATNNVHKIKELQALFYSEDLGVEVLSAAEIGGMPRVQETEESFEGNARLKAVALRGRVPEGAWVLSEDSGLCVDELGGAPGVHTARHAGEGATDEENNAKILMEMKDVSMDKRRARYVCCLVLIAPNGDEVVFHSICKGMLTLEPEGEAGFGYDPIFMPLGESKTFGELGSEVKNKISHRAQAVRQLADWMKREGVGVGQEG